MYVAIEAARPAFNRTIEQESERKLVFLALPAVTSVAHLPLDEQAQRLALTVWPAAFHVDPEPGESVAGYLERLCGRELATTCKHVVPEYWPAVLGTRAVRKLRERARDAVAACAVCKGEKSWESALRDYSKQVARRSAHEATAKLQGKPRQWPRAAENSRAYGGGPVLSVRLDGNAEFGGVLYDAWQDAISPSSSGTTLTLHLRPEDRVDRLREVLTVASAAGYREVALLTREAPFPYRLREYHLVPSSASRAVRVDTPPDGSIQMLVQALGIAAVSEDMVLAL